MEESKLRGITLKRVVTDMPETESPRLTKTDVELISGSAVVNMDPVSVDISHKLFGL